ncbi:protein mono-ADP-ribosyltransferase TIPARP-like [Aplochiton taeniatus]
MADLSPNKTNKKRKRSKSSPSEAPSNSSKVRLLSPSLLLLQIPVDSNISLPVWEALRSQQVDIAWNCSPYSINVCFTPLLGKPGGSQGPETSATSVSTTNSLFGTTQALSLPPGLSLPQIIIHSLPPQLGPNVSAPSVLVSFPESSASPQAVVPQAHCAAQGPGISSSFILPLPLIISQPQPVQQPNMPVKTVGVSCTAKSTRKKAAVSTKPPVCRYFHTNTSPNVPICDRFLIDICRTGLKCKQHHTPYPFYWQLKQGTGPCWTDLSPQAQVRLERVYCDVNRECVDLKEGVHIFSLNFGCTPSSMIVEDSEKYKQVRRLSNTTDPAKNPHFPTKWCIFWWNNTTWEEYKEDVSKLLLEKIQSQELECQFHIGGQQYKVDVSGMFQINVTTGFRRAIRCRPTFHSRALINPHLRTGVNIGCSTAPMEPPAANFNIDPLEQFSTWYPPVWDLSTEKDYSMLDVPVNSLAYLKVQSMFHKTLSENKTDILSIHQLQNILHWDKFQRYKVHMIKHDSEAGYLEKLLFHGTTEDCVEGICHNNFDPRVAGLNGLCNGYGSYFARNASYSANFADKTSGEVRHMFLAKVLIGKVSQGKSEYRRPPAVTGQEYYHLYDTCVDQLVNPSIFTVFDSCQCYPYYLIKYKDLPEVIDIHK